MVKHFFGLLGSTSGFRFGQLFPFRSHKQRYSLTYIFFLIDPFRSLILSQYPHQWHLPKSFHRPRAHSKCPVKAHPDNSVHPALVDPSQVTLPLQQTRVNHFWLTRMTLRLRRVHHQHQAHLLIDWPHLDHRLRLTKEKRKQLSQHQLNRTQN